MSKSCCGGEQNNYSAKYQNRTSIKSNSESSCSCSSELASSESSNTPVSAQNENENSGAVRKRKKRKVDACCAAGNDEEDSSSEKDEGSHSHEHSHREGNISFFGGIYWPLFSFVLLLLGLYFEHYLHPTWFEGPLRFVFYLIAYVPVGLPVLLEAYHSIREGDFFSEFFLMGIATLGAFAIGEYAEGVAVMLFYSVGELIQGRAVSRARSNIKDLLDQRPDSVTVLTEKGKQSVRAEEVSVGAIVELKPGEQLALDGVLFSPSGSFNSSALTGESLPETKEKGQEVLAGMVNTSSVVQVEVTRAYRDSRLSQILQLVQEASKHKAPTELFIRKFSRIYTPIVVVLALGITFLPALFVSSYEFSDWLYRALVFLVISCPCALVISIPLGYFGGIGAGSRNGILIKGSVYLDRLAATTHAVLDKTGTLTKGVFQVSETEFLDLNKEEEKELLLLVSALESHSTHPIASALENYLGGEKTNITFDKVEEVSGHGLKGWVGENRLLAGNFRLLDLEGVPYDPELKSLSSTQVAVAKNGVYQGFIGLSDQIKPEANEALRELEKMGIKTTVLSGDKKEVVEKVAHELGIRSYYGGLLPEDKVEKLQELETPERKVVFVGDGVNDAPVLALSDVGIAMGGLGSDAAIESADVVIQNDQVSKLPLAIKIGKKTLRVVWQNIILAFAIKAIVLVLGAFGLASMWAAVFADVGVALLAILNAVRIQYSKF